MISAEEIDKNNYIEREKSTNVVFGCQENKSINVQDSRKLEREREREANFKRCERCVIFDVLEKWECESLDV